MNKTHKTAQGLASLGRGPDKHLVHMSTNELHGLQNLAVMHGGSLTLNPKTGFPEAGVLDTILPMLAGAAVSYFSAGTATPLVMGLMQAGAGAATKAAITGKTDLGTLAGGALGGYGGGALASGLAGAGAGAANAEAAGAQGVELAGQGATQAAAAGAGPGVGTVLAEPAAGNFAGAAAQNAAAPSFAQQALAQGAPATYGQNVSAGVKGLTGMPGWQALGQNMTPSGKMAAGIGAMGVMSDVANSGSSSYKEPKSSYYMTSFDPRSQTYGPGQYTKDKKAFEAYLANNQVPAPTTPYPFADGGTIPVENKNYPTSQVPATGYEAKTDPYTGNETTLADYYAEMARGQNAPNQLPRVSGDAQTAYLSGLSSLLQQPSGPAPVFPSAAPATAAATANPLAGFASRFGGGSKGKKNATTPAQYYNFNPQTQQFSQQMAGGGLASLNSFSGGRYINGPGDGVSDSIPAVIHNAAGGQPAALAKNEFVVDARTVAELGNGSSEAGAQKLYAMMDRVAKARKNADIGQNTNADKYLPA